MLKIELLMGGLLEIGQNVKPSIARSLPRGEYTTTVLEINYQLLSIMLLK